MVRAAENWTARTQFWTEIQRIKQPPRHRRPFVAPGLGHIWRHQHELILLARDPGAWEPVHLKRSDWASDARLWKGVLEGKRIGAGVTVLFYSTNEIGKGPRWHVHPYEEIFIVRAGRARFTIGNSKVEAVAGDILLGPANVPHKYANLGPGWLETTDIHVSDRWIQTDLEDPEQKDLIEKTAVSA